MNYAYCWHRPGKRWKDHIYLCRHCGVAIEECRCVSWGRSTEKDCVACEGSGWVSMIRSRLQAMRDVLFGGYGRNADGWDDPDR